MTLGLWLLGLTAMARSGSDPQLAQSGQGVAGQTQQKRGQKPTSAPPKPVATPPPKKAEAPPPQRFRNLALTIPQRVDALIDALKPEERPDFLCVSQPTIDRLGIPAFEWSSSAMEAGLPAPIGIGASFDVDLASRIATFRALGAKGQALYVPIGVVRDPRWGLAGQTFGEDPLLTGSLAAAEVAELRRLGRVGEIGVLGDSGLTSEGSVELPSKGSDDLFFEPARMAIAADPAVGLRIDTFARATSSELFGAKFLADTVRKAWGLTGPIVAAGDTAKGAVDALLNGTDLFTEPDCKTLVEAAKTNPDVAKAMDRALRRVIETEMRAGIFDPPRPNAASDQAPNALSLLEARAADESIVLLKNQGGLLPLKGEYKSVAVIGPDADNPRAVLGSEPGSSSKVVTPLEAIKDALGPKTKVLYERGTGLVSREDLETVPASAFPDGLTTEYYNSSNFSGTPVARHEDTLDATWKGDPVDGVTAKNFSATWTGTLIPKVLGQYGLGVTVDGAVRVYLDDVLVIDDWKDGPIRTKTVPVDLSKADPFYVIRVEYARGAGSGSLRLVWTPPEDAPYRAAIEAAIKSDLVILVLGLDPSLEGPGHDRRDVALPDAQEGLLGQIAALGRPTVLVLLNGGPVSSPFAQKQIPAILEAWYPGEGGSAAIAGVLTGKVNPSGKLPVTLYPSNAQLPGSFEVDAPRTYRDSFYRPLFPFGSGLSFSKFDYSGLDVPPVVDGSKSVTVGITVKNLSRVAGEEVVQVYLSRENPSLGNPRIALHGFRRVHLNAGESRRVVFLLTPRDFSVLHSDQSRWLDAGAVQVSVGGNQPMDGQPATVSATVRTKGPLKLQ